ncbi:MAG: 23S rRNA (pseudouridine(1915)-N(3))-methyltransferase RlmH [Haliscomenobacteraceae bacterium CHB4]|nr:Ribosomal RNA large subunit methyltransferase H [Saprospiraceae bacterium]MCE7923731.1 23S rRNA (pseudouridine(1915)-N(3))-methyltransferase RlmH [Haliscomenobacteraceae bacterium CHB4]
MKIELWAIGKTSEKYLETGIEIFEKRIRNYLPFQWTVLPDVKIKTTDGARTREEEGKMLLSKLHSDDYLVLLDERGQEFTSVELSRWLERRLNASNRRLIFLIGGAFGFSPDVYARANESLALSRLTFSHQMVRLFFFEQLYRAMTILKNEPYHNG